MKKRLIDDKRLAFGCRIIKMVHVLQTRRASQNILNQVARSGTSIGANCAEGYYSQSSPDYITKHSIALKEANETKFWLTLLFEEQSLSQKEYNSLMNDLIQIIKILTTLVKTAKGL